MKRRDSKALRELSDKTCLEFYSLRKQFGLATKEFGRARKELYSAEKKSGRLAKEFC
ncbi:hypothetical protein [Candidatus Electronema sp. PJ]|uniref:hypothetical protein n=1 Tax=Candidatus Electronema sp. PJ TaxID=3401572 RepID=UPI003AA9C433